MKSATSVCLAMSSLLLLTGCQEAVKDAPQLSAARGVVTLAGQPLAGVNVTFYPDTTRDNKGPSATATTNSSGEFVLVCGMKEGAVAGFHKVTVECARLGSRISASGTPEPPAPCLVAPKFGSLATTTITAEVTPFESVIEIEVPEK